MISKYFDSRLSSLYNPAQNSRISLESVCRPATSSSCAANSLWRLSANILRFKTASTSTALLPAPAVAYWSARRNSLLSPAFFSRSSFSSTSRARSSCPERTSASEKVSRKTGSASVTANGSSNFAASAASPFRNFAAPYKSATLRSCGASACARAKYFNDSSVAPLAVAS